MIVVVMRYNYSVNRGYVFNLTRNFGVALGTKPAERATPFAEYGVEEDAEASREFDKVAGVAKPCCAEGGGFPSGEEGGFSDNNGWGCCIGFVVGA